MAPKLHPKSRIKIKDIIRRIKSKEKAQEVYDLAKKELERRKQIANSVNFKSQILKDNSIVFLCWNENTLLSKVRFKKINNNTWYANELLTDKLFRNLDLAKKTLEYAMLQLKAKGAKKILFLSRTKLIHFYEKLGAKRVKKTILQTLSDMEVHYSISGEFSKIPYTQMEFDLN